MQKRLTIVGTMRVNRKEIPREMLPDRQRPVYSSEFGFADEGVSLVSYVPKRNKAVVLLSAQHRDAKVASDDKAKPEIIHYYNATKSGVDVLDKLIRTYSCKRPSRRWTVCLFWNVLDIAAYNALVLWITQHPSWNSAKSHVRRLFLRELGTELVSNHASRRLHQQPHGKRRRIQDSGHRAGFIIPQPQRPDSSENSPVRRRCRDCPRSKESKTPRRCDVCKRNVCKEHSSTLTTCASCANPTDAVCDTV